MELKFPVLQSVDQPLQDSESSRDFCLVGCPNFEIPVCLEFGRPFAKCLSQALTKLEFSFALSGIAVGEPLLADVLDSGDDLLKFGDSNRDLFDRRGFRSGSLLFSRACPCHGRVKKSI